MATPFSNTTLRVPRGFGNILEGLAREVLREQPSDIPTFAAHYFAELLQKREESGFDPAEWGARLEDRFYNNHAFKDTAKQESWNSLNENKHVQAESYEHNKNEITQSSQTFSPSSKTIDAPEDLKPQHMNEYENTQGDESGGGDPYVTPEISYRGTAGIDICAEELRETENTKEQTLVNTEETESSDEDRDEETGLHSTSLSSYRHLADVCSQELQPTMTDDSLTRVSETSKPVLDDEGFQDVPTTHNELILPGTESSAHIKQDSTKEFSYLSPVEKRLASTSKPEEQVVADYHSQSNSFIEEAVTEDNTEELTVTKPVESICIPDESRSFDEAPKIEEVLVVENQESKGILLGDEGLSDSFSTLERVSLEDSRNHANGEIRSIAMEDVIDERHIDQHPDGLENSIQDDETTDKQIDPGAAFGSSSDEQMESFIPNASVEPSRLDDPVEESRPDAPGEESRPDAPGEESRPDAPGEESRHDAPVEESRHDAPVEESRPDDTGEESSPDAPVEESRPDAPVEESRPDDPVQESRSDTPVERDRPDDPEEESRPDDPEEESRPDDPEEESRPDDPEEESRPDDPEEESRPDDPEEESRPDDPEEESRPDDPEEESRPDDPEEESRPDDPEEESRPDDPEEESRPDDPEEESRPDDPEEESRPDDPEEESRPDDPGEESRPDDPGEESRPDDPGEESRPDDPEEESRPDDPGEESRPNDPGEESRPDDPEEESRPDDPREESRPDDPREESRPDDPGEESRPDAPGEESRPDDPMEESRPDDPGEESRPGTPVEESRPDAPVERDTPDAPVEESRPDAPGEESRPGAPGEESRLDDPMEESRLDDPMEESRLDDPMEESRPKAPMEESRPNTPMEDSRPHAPVEESRFDDPMEESRPDAPVEPISSDTPVEQSNADVPVDPSALEEENLPDAPIEPNTLNDPMEHHTLQGVEMEDLVYSHHMNYITEDIQDDDRPSQTAVSVAEDISETIGGHNDPNEAVLIKDHLFHSIPTHESSDNPEGTEVVTSKFTDSLEHSEETEPDTGDEEDIDQELMSESRNKELDQQEESNQPQEEEDIMDIPLDDPEANKAAAKIQAGFRGHMTRKKLKPGEKPGEEVSSSGETLNGSQGDAAGGSEGVETDETPLPEQ